MQYELVYSNMNHEVNVFCIGITKGQELVYKPGKI